MCVKFLMFNNKNGFEFIKSEKKMLKKNILSDNWNVANHSRGKITNQIQVVN